ncbi:PROTEIN FAR1-RELATED SEQUENCE 12-RELATED [Salix purpurea]|uniref:Protein FAR1-RELATED SEQUENCE n=1 Tax=Salix purpurea TaxID=77065 RepID=A0A9Q0U8K6_SALPP|nr:PROTEIN FAR1-RELATED SEQUENCE 12-RELATED [Salix purpurea]
MEKRQQRRPPPPPLPFEIHSLDLEPDPLVHTQHMHKKGKKDMVFDSIPSLFNNIKSSNSDPYSEEYGNAVIVRAYPLGMVRANSNVNVEGGRESGVEPHKGLEFDSADDARQFYNVYATRVGFRTRTGQLYRSRTDGSVSSRRFVCSKEGFQLSSRTGCPAFIRVQRRDSGKWVIDQMHKDHNHQLGDVEESHPPVLQQKAPMGRKSSVEVSSRKKLKLLAEVDDGQPCSSGSISVKRVRTGANGQPIAEPYAGLVFTSPDEAYNFYVRYADEAGFKTRIGQLFRSKNDGSITSRRFVCSKEGFQHPSRVGCGAFMRIKRQESGTWMVDRLQKDHNHDLEPQTGTHKKSSTAPKKFIDEVNGGLDSLDLLEINNGVHFSSSQGNNIGSEWYRLLLDYFQRRQAEDTGFFYSMEVDNGVCMSIFWADGRSRFACSQFGDVVVLDTSYRKTNYLVPFATFVGVNHHKQPVLLGCALIANESKESFIWLFRTWLRAMSGCRPKSIIADQDMAIQQAIGHVFPGTRHRFSMWQIREKERENLRSVSTEFKYEYEKCIYESQTNAEFNTMWNALVNKYGLKENAWLKEMYEKRESWVPLYLRGTFFAGIPMNESMEPFFGIFLNAETPLGDFIARYEQGLAQRREEERKEDFNSSNLQAFLQTKEPIEEQCRRLYTLNVFQIFQKELLQCYNYLGIKSYEEGTISRYSVRRCGNELEKHMVTFSASNLDVSCSCQMFEFEGVLCRHVLRVFIMLDIREIPSCYLLHRWTRNAEHGIVCDVDSGVSFQELKGLMVWSLRETACKYIESGTTSLEKYRLACEIMREGTKKVCRHR